MGDGWWVRSFGRTPQVSATSIRVRGKKCALAGEAHAVVRNARYHRKVRGSTTADAVLRICEGLRTARGLRPTQETAQTDNIAKRQELYVQGPQSDNTS